MDPVRKVDDAWNGGLPADCSASSTPSTALDEVCTNLPKSGLYEALTQYHIFLVARITGHDGSEHFYHWWY
jgi:hypothetical protein